jgi:hypothetical protein
VKVGVCTVKSARAEAIKSVAIRSVANIFAVKGTGLLDGGGE